MNVKEKGFAVININTTIKVPLIAESFEPKFGNALGGDIMLIKGTGFSKKTNVLIDNKNCRVLEATYSLLKCIVPSNVIQRFSDYFNDTSHLSHDLNCFNSQRWRIRQ